MKRRCAWQTTIEGYFSIFKCGMKVVYQHCKEKHLHRYLAEFDFRYNARQIADGERALRDSKRRMAAYISQTRSKSVTSAPCL